MTKSIKKTDPNWETQDKIEIPIFYHVDEETGEKVYDFEEMANEFENRLSLLTGVVVMCSVSDDIATD
jgi:hypothetical protein